VGAPGAPLWARLGTLLLYAAAIRCSPSQLCLPSANLKIFLEEWDVCAALGDCRGYRPDHEDWGRGASPVMNISWEDARPELLALLNSIQAPWRARFAALSALLRGVSWAVTLSNCSVS
jgi:hypothetical protein